MVFSPWPPEAAPRQVLAAAMDFQPNALTLALRRHAEAGLPLLDLTVANPTAVGLAYPPGWLADLGAEQNAFPYSPDPQGEPAARAAIARYLTDQGMAAAAEHILITASTSEAYAWAFRCLAQAGDEIAVMTPGYPLCDALAQWCDLTLLAWPWRRDAAKRWETNWEGLEQSLTTRTKALVLIHPNNPTGQYLTAADFAAALALAEGHGLALIVDTVFWDYAHAAGAAFPVPASRGPLVFTLGGLSKTCALPQVKLGWMHVSGEPLGVRAALEKLTWIADAFLSAATPIQRLAPRLLAERDLIQKPLQARLNENLAVAKAILDPHVEMQWPEAGWALPLRLPHCGDDEQAVLSLLQEEGMLVQPGYFFDYAEEGHCLVSLITPPPVFRQGLERLLTFCRRHAWINP